MKVLLIIVLSFALVVYGNYDFRPDYKYRTVANGWLKYHNVPATWWNARFQCDFEGAVLASPLDVDMMDLMKSLVFDSKYSSSGVHVGFSNFISRVQFHSVEGISLKLFSNNDMFSEEFNSAPSCMRLIRSTGLVAGNCDEFLPYICYKKKTVDLQVTECGTTDKGYTLDNRTGHCYKFHEHVQTWPLAFQICEAEGGHLAIANSVEEANVLKEIFAKHPDSSFSGGYKGGIHLGFLDWKEYGYWRTIHGQRLEEAGYKKWGNGQPDNQGSMNGPGQHCGSMFRSGNLDDIQCNRLSTFICEKVPEPLGLLNNAQK